MSTSLLLLSLCLLLPLVLALPNSSVSPLFNSSWYSRKLILPIQAVAAIARRIYTQTIHGELSGRDMVQIAALCSVFPAFWYLRNGRKSKTRSSTSNDSKLLDGTGHETISKRSVDINESETVDPGLLKKAFRNKNHTARVDLRILHCGFSLADMPKPTTALLASITSPRSIALSENVIGLVAICPLAEPPSEDEVSKFRKALWVPNLIFDIWRRWDRRGGTESASVHRFVGRNADQGTKKLQERFNRQSKTAVWRRMASGSLPVYENHIAKGGLPGENIWKGLDMPVFLVAGEADNITKPGEIEKIAQFLGRPDPVPVELNDKNEPVVDTAAPADIPTETKSTSIGNNLMTEKHLLENNSISSTDSSEEPSTPDDFDGAQSIPPQPLRPRKVFKTTIIPAPASHALLYMPSTVRTLAGLILGFSFLSTSGKWDVKNLAKWQAVNPVSEPIAGVFRAMKTLREVDETHCPSHESPVYDPRGLEKGGVRYHKFPTVSKIPPTSDEVATFINLIDRLRDEQTARKEKEGVDDEWFVGVHCHYGFNRTGYFIVCYLVERCGYEVQGAIDEFAQRRPKGIKHAHFMDQLFVRYCVGLKRAPTL
ncbi:hypothetical protein EYC84_008362 [Monilinia fructicola]|uniref:Tyrosine specific protein phosphatases domain-containing protein n=1 Tax=Monilinia fructicola TaxID=38448 RepID=A0A5M9JGY1_MONFR|nr:hypothetical protein EYC84_008362 [Monilinia fructicola]